MIFFSNSWRTKTVHNGISAPSVHHQSALDRIKNTGFKCQKGCLFFLHLKSVLIDWVAKKSSWVEMRGTCCASSKPKWGTTDWGLGRLEGLGQCRQLWFFERVPPKQLTVLCLEFSLKFSECLSDLARVCETSECLIPTYCLAMQGVRNHFHFMRFTWAHGSACLGHSG